MLLHWDTLTHNQIYLWERAEHSTINDGDEKLINKLDILLFVRFMKEKKKKRKEMKWKEKPN